ncbi:multidrug efflux RND transporter permease subunit [Oleiagrimonas sp.]|jgi:multidrug efflux pump|uniref:multidrug efflux RND transporter permease subunit n=1 Tax=Oleiagrimonas sp. TaxID=2010330 RepID=UPI00260A9C10|nr:multidrug efflux RND transporter permease subunit [Oleiagrimonas sp.]MDA3913182.1 multidrug efflux RND transporter permease subunit [Oleiagrimonas sp.]
MPSFFIDRPIFAWVVAILISIGGIISIANLGVESYPNIAPPQVTVSANYPGASAATAEKTVTQVIEQQLIGIDNLLYFSSSTSSSGNSSITLTFKSGTDPDIAQVQVQNKVSLAQPRLPSEVVQQGVVVAKSNPDFLTVVALRSTSPDTTLADLNDLLASRVQDQISRLPGVGNTRLFGSEYAMRIWLNPTKMAGYGLSATQVLAAVRGQNVQFATGSIGADPAVKGQGYTATVTGASRFTTPEQFRNIILRSNSDGTSVRLKDVAKVELGPESYGRNSTFDGDPAAGIAVQLAPGANALTVVQEVDDTMNQLSKSLPRGVTWFSPFDSTTFVHISINEVVQTLIEAVVLVFLVMLLFLQNLRATLIPTLVIPVALLGTFMGMLILGFTINQLTLFGMVLAIGIVVDDAIVVIENVERLMSEEQLPPKEATRKAMGQITGAIVAITVVLAAVFIPTALQPGSVGAIYKQFALTIALSMGFSAFLATSFTPALCASFLKPTGDKPPNAFFRKFNNLFGWMTRTYTRQIGSAVRHAPRWMIVFVLISLLCGFALTRLPGGFMPDEDQGYALAIVQLPPGASIQRTNTVMKQVGAVLKKSPAFGHVFLISGFSFVGQGENVGMAFIKLKNWSKRDETAQQYIQKTNGQLAMAIKDARVFVVNLPTVRGLGRFGGFEMYLEAREGQSNAALTKARNILLGKASKDKMLQGVRPNGLEPAPQLKLSVNRTEALSMGLSVSDVYNAIQLMLAPVYVNDFVNEGRIKRVIMQAQARYRMNPDALSQIYSPASASSSAGTDGAGKMIPISSVIKTSWSVAPPALQRYNGYPAVNIVGNPAPGYSSGQAMNEMQKIVNTDLPKGFGLDWTGQSYQEVVSGNQAPLLFGLSLVVVFLALAALYESWSIPVAVLLVVPLGVLGAVLFALGRGLENDVFFKIGLITIIGLAAKNAILIVEFAVEHQARGLSLRKAVIEAARLRLRPILMTSLAFILGVFPLAVSTGAGANARHAIGTGVVGGMLFATFLGLLLIPVFYVSVRRMLGDKLDARGDEHEDGDGPQLFDSDPYR